MSLSDIRTYLNKAWEKIDSDALENKDSNSATIKLINLYEEFDPSSRNFVNEVIIEWLDTNNQRKIFDALALINHFQISSALPMLHNLENQLQKHINHETPYTLAKIRRIIDKLDNIKNV